MDNLREVEPKTGMPLTGMPLTGMPLIENRGPYQVQEELGRGFSSVVYLAADLRRGRTVALKVLTFPPDLPPALRADLTERFRREARAVAGLTHPSIVSVFDFGETPEGQPYLALERLCGQSLRQRLRSAGRLPLTEALPIALRVAEALDYAHGRGIVHRDIKPDNLFLCLPGDDGSAAVPKLMDFGISRTLSDQELTQDGMVVGSPAYMSPEQISGEMVDGRADVFSLAVTLVEMLTGRKPFEADTVPAVMQQILRQPPRLDGLSHPRLERVLRKAMAKRPGQRYASAAAFAEALRRAAPLSAPAPSVTTQFARPVRMRKAFSGRGLWLGAAALAGAAIGIGAVRQWQPAPPRTASAAVRSVPVYVYRTRVIKTVVPAAPTAAKPVSPPLPPPRLAVLFASARPTSARPNTARPTSARPNTARRRPAPKLARLALRPRRLAPPPPVVIQLASAETPPPTVRVSDTRQEAVRRPDPAPSKAALPNTLPDTLPDGPPHLLTRTLPLLPPGVIGDGAQVTLHLRINRFGEVTDADVVQASGNDDLDAAALDAVGGWTYAPARHNGRPVRGETDAVVSFPAS